jgi:hypothetical protein
MCGGGFPAGLVGKFCGWAKISLKCIQKGMALEVVNLIYVSHAFFDRFLHVW